MAAIAAGVVFLLLVTAFVFALVEAHNAHWKSWVSWAALFIALALLIHFYLPL